MALTSAAGFISLLDDERQDIKAFALKRLTDLVDEFWAEISESVDKIEILYEDSSFAYNKAAALLASKVYFHLGEYDDALHFALCAEELFDPNAKAEYVRTMITKCIDKYTSIRAEDEINPGSKLSAKDLKSSGRKWSVGDGSTYFQLETVVNRMFNKCFAHKQFKQALGIAIETRRDDIFEKAIILADDRDDMLRYALKTVLTLVDSVKLRNRLLTILVQIYSKNPTPADSVHICQCLVLMDNSKTTAEVLENLILLSEEASVTAYQIGFDLYENATQQFLHGVTDALSKSEKIGHLIEKVDPSAKNGESEPKKNEVASGEPIPTSESTSLEESKVELSVNDKAIKKRLELLNSILSGDKVIELHLQFLIRNNKADLRLLERIKEDVRNSVTHNATVIANSLMHCGTTSDQFLRDHLTWLGKAVNWAKFTATATLGVIHRGNEKEALRLMSAYLPKDASGSSGSFYTEGGGLYALGLIHANHGGSMTEYLFNQCKEATAEPVRHGACLGLGLAAMGTGREDIYDQIKQHLYQDDAITGEAAGLAMGLVMLGTGSSTAVNDLLSYTVDTSHEKIMRGIALGIALIMFGKREEADELINNLIQETDPIIRWCGMATIAMAYCGTNNNAAIEKLLHAAVSDTNDDVRRWALTALGFVMFKDADKVPSLVSLLAESYHPHLRYGAAMALGIACAGTANKEAIALLEQLLDGTVHFVRQGALIAMAMVLMQQNAVSCPKSAEFRERCLKIISDRHEDMLAKFGAILACGILDAGGCNMTISLQTRIGNTNMLAAVGLLVFQNFWFWYPLTNFISLAFSPTAIIGLNKNLEMPQMQFRSNAKPSMFAYPPPLQIEKEKKKEKVETAILSITAKHKKRGLEKRKPDITSSSADSDKFEKMDVDSQPSSSTTLVMKKEPQKEPNFSILSNPARVLRSQQRVLSLPENCRYYSIKPITQAGILLFHDHRPDEKEVLVETVQPHGPVLGGRGGKGVGKSIGTGAGGSGPSDAASADEASPDTPVHASLVGAVLEDDDLDEDIDDEQDGDSLSEDAEDESQDGEDSLSEEDDDIVGVDDIVDDAEMDDALLEEMGEQFSSAVGGQRSHRSPKQGGQSGGASSSSGTASEPAPPEAFLWTEEDENATATTAGASATKTTNTTTTATASTGGNSGTATTQSQAPHGQTVAEPMDTDSPQQPPATEETGSDVDEMIARQQEEEKKKKNP
ncbi:unnamed protein product [Rodentolepis nana]|uniref:26S proteasome non-ATPase regulatory subunit 1 n=1 Tax=Rodentolepis nana TaxID=102285 RepID=A0A0R3T7C5_RODNA|nr:unnamed protein product [Rodentolepis nana]